MEGYLGQIMIFAGNFAPRNWEFCHGQLQAISQNQALFSIIGTIYGGDGRTTMGLPDLRGRVALGEGNGPGLSSYSVGEKAGKESVTLTENNLPSHTHHLMASSSQGDSASAKNCNLAAAGGAEFVGNVASGVAVTGTIGTGLTLKDLEDGMTSESGAVSGEVRSLPYVSSGVDVNMSQAAITNTGGNESFSQLQPFQAVHYIICVDGMYPSRS